MRRHRRAGKKLQLPKSRLLQVLDQTWKVSRLNFVKYDAESLRKNEELKYAVQNVERYLLNLPECRERSLAMTAMEEMFMWIGKTIRNDQLERERVGDG